MATQTRWGILSTANIGAKRVIPAIHNSHNGLVHAVASRNQQRAQQFAARLNIPKAHGSYEALLTDPDIDAIYIPLPNAMHAEWCLKAAEAGKPVLCEKPLATDADQAQQMVDAFAERNILFAEAFMYRFHPQHQRVHELIASGGIGELRVINATFSFAVRDAGNIRLNKDLAGGALMDVGCYCVNAMRWLTAEEPQQAQAFADFGGASDVDETLTGILRFPSGVVGHFDASLRLHRCHQYEVRGTQGRIVVETAFVPDLTPGAMTTVHHWQGDDYNEMRIPTQDQYQLMVEDFAHALQTGGAVRYPPQDAVQNMRAIDMLITAARLNAGQR
jgi:D-xylose 1-dehydrogenase (NADP+, D-xylono-1,5-lactone-forming)